MRRPVSIRTVLVSGGLCLAVLGGCYGLRGSSGGGETSFTPPRRVDPAGVVVPDGYAIEAVATGLTFPTGVAFDAGGAVYVVEAGYAYGEVFTTPRLVRIASDGTVTPIATGTSAPWNGVTFHEGAFYIAGGGQKGDGHLVRISPDGTITPVVEGLPGYGDHHPDGPVAGPDGRLYFGVGSATNAGIVGPDNAAFGWLHRYPDFHDRPCRDVTLTGTTFRSENPLTPDDEDEAVTGAFVPFGTSTEAGQRIAGAVPCAGAVMRVAPGGGTPELVAWGFRNPFGLAFSPDGRLFVADNAYDDRGSRPVWGTGDYLWEVEEGLWYGWPDFAGGVPLSEFRAPGGPELAPLLAEHPNEPPHPAALLGVHSSSSGLDFSRSEAFGFAGDVFIAQFGDMAPGVGKVLSPVGFQVVRVEVETGVVHGFAANVAGNGPASSVGGDGFERPVAVRFDPRGAALYVVDFGVLTTGEEGPTPYAETGVLWRIYREASS